jgi:hypothetical protein
MMGACSLAARANKSAFLGLPKGLAACTIAAFAIAISQRAWAQGTTPATDGIGFDISSPANDGGGQPSNAGSGASKLTIADWNSPEYKGLQGTRGNAVVARGYFAWRFGDSEQLLRISIPVTTAAAGNASSADAATDDFPEGPTGLDDVEIYNLSQFTTGWGIFRIGPVFTLPTGTHSGVGNGQWTAGPAAGFEAKFGDLTLGAFSRNYFSIAGATGSSRESKTKLQPIIEWALDDGWSVGTSDMHFTYNWVKGQFTNLPLGGEIGKNFEFSDRPMNLSLQAEYNFANAVGSAAWTARVTWMYRL